MGSLITQRTQETYLPQKPNLLAGAPPLLGGNLTSLPSLLPEKTEKVAVTF